MLFSFSLGGPPGMVDEEGGRGPPWGGEGPGRRGPEVETSGTGCSCFTGVVCESVTDWVRRANDSLSDGMGIDMGIDTGIDTGGMACRLSSGGIEKLGKPLGMGGMGMPAGRLSLGDGGS